MASPQPYTINIPDDKIERLKQKLALTDFPHDGAEFHATSWAQGPPVKEVQRLALYWQTEYDWRAAESLLNKLPNFTASIALDELKHTFDIHFVHQRSNRINAIPLLFLHGWPGSFIEVTRIIEGLIGGDGESSPTFHVVAPSLVDFGFSSSSTKGFRMEHHASLYHQLMILLGYDRYVIQAGDVGSIISRFMAKKFGSAGVMAHHTNTPWPLEPSKDTHPKLYEESQVEPLTERETNNQAKFGQFVAEGRGYYSIMATRPTTIGYALRDSPVALLAWIYEKLCDWSDNYAWTDDEILTWVSIHYFSVAGPEAPSNAYYALDHDTPPAFVTAAAYMDLPLGISRFENDLVVLPKLWNHTLGPIVYVNEHPRGGHFAAWENPPAIVQDLRTMFRKDGPLGLIVRTF